MEINKVNNGSLTMLSVENQEFIKRQLPMVVGSDGKTLKFEEKRIEMSILRETSAPEDVAHYVTMEVKKMLLVSKQKVVTAPYIREKVCCTLFNLNPKWRDEYTRLGIPYADFKSAYGHLFDDIENWEKLTPQDIYDHIVPKMNSVEIIELIFRIAKDYIGVRNNIEAHNEE